MAPGGSALLCLEAARMSGSSRNCSITVKGSHASDPISAKSCRVGKSGWCARICEPLCQSIKYDVWSSWLPLCFSKGATCSKRPKLSLGMQCRVFLQCAGFAGFTSNDDASHGNNAKKRRVFAIVRSQWSWGKLADMPEWCREAWTRGNFAAWGRRIRSPARQLPHPWQQLAGGAPQTRWASHTQQPCE